jgi:hypothetical protein
MGDDFKSRQSAATATARAAAGSLLDIAQQKAAASVSTATGDDTNRANVEKARTEGWNNPAIEPTKAGR